MEEVEYHPFYEGFRQQPVYDNSVHDVADDLTDGEVMVIEEDEGLDVNGETSNPECSMESVGEPNWDPGNIVIKSVWSEKTNVRDGIKRSLDDPSGTFTCEICQKTFPRDRNLKRHMKRHSMQVFPCKYCPKTYKDSYNRNKHERLHTGENVYPCSLCGKIYTCGYELRIHACHSVKHGEHLSAVNNGAGLGGRTETDSHQVEYTCRLCFELFYTEESWREHEQLHAEEQDGQGYKDVLIWPTAEEPCESNSVHKEVEEMDNPAQQMLFQNTSQGIDKVCSIDSGRSTVGGDEISPIVVSDDEDVEVKIEDKQNDIHVKNDTVSPVMETDDISSPNLNPPCQEMEKKNGVNSNQEPEVRLGKKVQSGNRSKGARKKKTTSSKSKKRAPKRKTVGDKVGKNVTCPTCTKTFSDKYYRDKHKASCQPGLRCQPCGVLLASKAEVLEHLERTHGFPTISSNETQAEKGKVKGREDSSKGKGGDPSKVKGRKDSSKVKGRKDSSKVKERKNSTNDYFECYVCGDSFRDKNSLGAHMSVHNGTASVGKAAASDLKRQKNVPGNDQHPSHTQPSGEAFTEVENDKQVMPDQEENTMFSCSLCCLKFGSSFDFSKHLKTHTMFGHTCSVCQKVFVSEAKLKCHMEVHGALKPIDLSAIEPHEASGSSHESSCQQMNQNRNNCNQGSEVGKVQSGYQSQGISKNSNSSTCENPYKCGICQKTFKVPSQLRRHMAIHDTYRKPVPCDRCSKTFFDIDRHRLDCRSPSKRFPCQQCGVILASKESVQEHLEKEHGYMPLTKNENPAMGNDNAVCPDCGMVFTVPEEFQEHYQKHTKIPPFICYLCQQPFSQRCDLKRHMDEHVPKAEPEEQASFTCSLCDVHFVNQESLSSHLAVHTHKFRCVLCLESFLSNEILRAHQSMHEKDGLYPCSLCDSVYTTLDKIEAHMMSSHR